MSLSQWILLKIWRKILLTLDYGEWTHLKNIISVKTRNSAGICCICSIQRYFENNDLQILSVWAFFRVSWSKSTRFVCKANMLTKVPFSSYNRSQILSKKRLGSNQTNSVIKSWSSFDRITGRPWFSYVCGS